MASPSEDSYKLGLANVILIALIPLPMALGWLVRFGIRSPSARTILRVVMGGLGLAALALAAQNPVQFMPATTLGFVLNKWTLEVYMRALFHPVVVIPVLWLAPVAYFLQDILLELMNAKPKTPKVEPEPNARRVNSNRPQDINKGVLIGATYGKRPVFVTPEELNKHTALIGTTGSGKTTTLYNFIEYNAAKKQACIIIDGKGDRDFLDTAKVIIKSTGQEPILFAIDGDYPGYNPFATGGATETADKIMSLMDYSEEHYERNAQTFVQLLMRGLQINQIPISFESIVRHFSKEKVQALLSRHSPEEILQSDDLFAAPKDKSQEARDSDHYLSILKSLDNKAVEGLVARLGALASGETWEALKTRPRGFISLSEILDKKQIVIFSLDSLKYPETARAFGRLVVGDIKAQISEHTNRRRGQRVGLLFDEFNVFASAAVVDVVNKSRAAGFEALLAFQSLADIDVLEKGEEIRRQIVQSCNTLIVQRQNDPNDAEELSRAIGTRDSYQMTYQTAPEGTTGLGSARPVKEFVVHPDDIKKLRTGEAFIKRHTQKGLEIKKVWIRQPPACKQ